MQGGHLQIAARKTNVLQPKAGACTGERWQVEGQPPRLAQGRPGEVLQTGNRSTAALSLSLVLLVVCYSLPPTTDLRMTRSSSSQRGGGAAPFAAGLRTLAVAALSLSLFASTSSSATPLVADFADHDTLIDLYEKGTFGRSPTTHYHSTSLAPPSLLTRTPKRRALWSSSDGSEEQKLLTFIGARGADAAEPAPYLFDDDGELVWSGRKGNVMNFQRHTYLGEPVLAWYTGKLLLSAGCTGSDGGGMEGARRWAVEADLEPFVGSEEFPGYGHGQWQIYDETYTLIATGKSLDCAYIDGEA